MILYLHGFRSSPQAAKACLLRRKMEQLGRLDELRCPQLPASPQQAVALALELVAGCAASDLTIIGSSLGGFYATWLAERLGCRAVLLNPTVKPLRDLAHYMELNADGKATLALTHFHSGEEFDFKPEYKGQMQALEVATITRPERYYLIAATGDELLNWHDMVGHYPQAKQLIVQGSDHGLSDFADYLDGVLAFCATPPAVPGA
jgi:predicted esterase YcpF (UPF0227 family)